MRGKQTERARTREFTLYFWLDYEEEDEDEDAEEWNEMDFEVVDMQDPLRPSVTEPSRNPLMAPTLEVSAQFLANAVV